MARTRMLKPGFFKNEDLCSLEPFCRILFAGLWTLADAEGKLEDRPRRIKAELFPYDDLQADELLSTLHSARFIYRYRVDGQAYIYIPNWSKHQHPHKNERDEGSIIPNPDRKLVSDWLNAVAFGSSTDKIGTCTAETGRTRVDTLILNPLTHNGVSASGDAVLFDISNPPFDPVGSPEPLKQKQRRWFEEQIWPRCWRRIDKPEAFKKFCLVCKTEEMLAKIVAAMDRHRLVYEQREMEHRPYLATWFNKRRFEDADPEAGEAPADIPGHLRPNAMM